MTIKMMTSTKGCTSNSTRFLSNRSSSSMTVSYVVVVVTLLLLNNGIVGTVAQSNTHSNTTHHSSPTSPPVSSTATTPTSPPTAASKCPMTCQHGGHCKVGTADYSMHPVEPSGLPFIFLMETSKDGWYCDCPVGHTGIHCGRPYVTCPDPDNSTSPHYCYHGGQCVEGLANSTAVAEHHRFCNCSAAQYNGIPYFGKYCEIEGAHKCSADSDVFCTAHGTCKDGFETMAHPCECPAGYRGPHCEFLRGQVPDCTLTCHHGGECTLGLKDFEVAQYEEFWSSHDGNFQHCVSRRQQKLLLLLLLCGCSCCCLFVCCHLVVCCHVLTVLSHYYDFFVRSFRRRRRRLPNNCLNPAVFFFFFFCSNVRRDGSVIRAM